MGTPNITPKMTPNFIFIFEFMNSSWYFLFEFINFRPGRDFINGRGLLIPGGDYTHTFCHRKLRNEQVPTRSPIALAQFQTIRNYSIYNSKFNEIGCTSNLLGRPGLQPRGKFAPLDPGNHSPPLSGHTSTGLFQSFRGRRGVIATVFAVIQALNTAMTCD